jgi:uncharacterized protein YijF (DUF1287 family)
MKLRWIGFMLVVPMVGATVVWYRHGGPQPPGTLRSNVAVGNLDAPWKNEVEGAHEEATQNARYDASYVRIAYPDGDVPITQGACTDVVIRSMRHAGYDLQQLIHEDIARRPSAYPRASRAPDTNIDHRRIPNQIAFFKKYGEQLTNDVSSSTLKDWRGGDVVYWETMPGCEHTGVVSDLLGPSGNPMVIHNIAGCTEEDVLTKWKIIGHYRYPASRDVNRKS